MALSKNGGQKWEKSFFAICKRERTRLPLPFPLFVMCYLKVAIFQWISIWHEKFELLISNNDHILCRTQWFHSDLAFYLKTKLKLLLVHTLYSAVQQIPFKRLKIKASLKCFLWQEDMITLHFYKLKQGYKDSFSISISILKITHNKEGKGQWETGSLPFTDSKEGFFSFLTPVFKQSHRSF